MSASSAVSVTLENVEVMCPGLHQRCNWESAISYGGSTAKDSGLLLRRPNSAAALDAAATFPAAASRPSSMTMLVATTESLLPKSLVVALLLSSILFVPFRAAKKKDCSTFGFNVMRWNPQFSEPISC